MSDTRSSTSTMRSLNREDSWGNTTGTKAQRAGVLPDALVSTAPCGGGRIPEMKVEDVHVDGMRDSWLAHGSPTKKTEKRMPWIVSALFGRRPKPQQAALTDLERGAPQNLRKHMAKMAKRRGDKLSSSLQG